MPRWLNESFATSFLGREILPFIRHSNKKRWTQQLREFTRLTLKYYYPPYQYFNAGLYDKDATDDVSNYLPPVFISDYRDQLNQKEGCRLINDKHIFRKTIKAGAVAVVEELFLIDSNGVVFGPDGDILDGSATSAILAGHGEDIFIKPMSGRFGLDTAVVTPKDFDGFFASDPRDVIVQPRLIQHAALAELHPSSVNTIRIDTLRAKGGWVHNAAVLRIGTGGSVVDNGIQRGLIVGIDLETGALQPLARSRSQFGTARVTSHLETGVTFDGRYIPYWQEVRALVCAGADILLEHGLQSLGWDVAVLSDGPCLIEANAGWSVSIMQIGWGGLARTEIGRRALFARRAGGKTISHKNGSHNTAL